MLIGRSVECGPCQLPQQRWKRMVRRQSLDRVVERVDLHLGHPVALDSGLLLRLIPVLGDRRIVECRVRPASTIALYSSRIASAQA